MPVPCLDVLSVTVELSALTLVHQVGGHVPRGFYNIQGQVRLVAVNVNR